MAGHYGEEMFTIKNLQVIKVDPQTQEVWVNGPIPGATDAVVTIEVTKEGKFEGLREVAPVESASEPETTTENKE
jgi:ribosomal protein L3